ncbi:MAG TPA: histidine kinase dimerization/phosphoacceptor domain -containing protein [Sphingomonas sp.]
MTPDPVIPSAESPPSAIARAFARLSTSMKMLIIQSLALLPLGMMASLASLETAHTNRANRELAAHLLAGNSADRLSLFIERSATTLRAAGRLGAQGCRRTADALGGTGTGTARVALFDARGALTCASRAFTATLPLRATGAGPLVTIDPRDNMLRLILANGTGWGLVEIPRTMLVQASHPNALDGSYDLRLIDASGGQLRLAQIQSLPIGHDIVTSLPVANGQLQLVMTIESTPLSANEVLMVLLPILMWVAGAAIGWLVIDRLIFRPLAEMQAAVDLYRLRDGALRLPVLTTPAHELRDLGAALAAAAATIERHEADLEAGLARQTRLTREVHHRVKNNLQVIASLLNIHARGAETPEAVNAYAAIQRRVEALALVHRSHYAELEVNRGVALRPLIGELAANLRASAPQGLASPAITLDLHLFSSHQDVAVPVAFMVTELIEIAMLRMPGARIAIGLTEVEGKPDRARLSVRSPALRRDAAAVDERYERFERVLGGLSRQLRATPERDDDSGLFAIEISVIPAQTGA